MPLAVASVDYKLLVRLESVKTGLIIKDNENSTNRETYIKVINKSTYVPSERQLYVVDVWSRW